MVTQRSEIAQITVLANGVIWVQRADLFFEQGVQVGKTYHRHVVAPGDDPQLEHGRVRAIMAAVHTSEVISEFQANHE